jgi:YgiT-type zinc finger domain-containing protein
VKCHLCGSDMLPITTDLPFKIRETAIAVVKAVPVLQCSHCVEYMLEDAVMERVDRILSAIDDQTELEIVRFAA